MGGAWGKGLSPGVGVSAHVGSYGVDPAWMPSAGERPAVKMGPAPAGEQHRRATEDPEVGCSKCALF